MIRKISLIVGGLVLVVAMVLNFQQMDSVNNPTDVTLALLANSAQAQGEWDWGCNEIYRCHSSIFQCLPGNEFSFRPRCDGLYWYSCTSCNW